MKEFLLWWAGSEAVGLAAFPLAFVFFHRLPDRGFAFAKVIGLLLLGYGLWAGAVVGVFPNSRGSVILLLLIIAGLSLAVAGRQREALAAYLRSGWRYLLLVEGMFLAVLAAGVYMRSFAPEVFAGWGEKQFELAFLNAVNRSEFFPPHDPWLSGETISYYYFGYVMVAALSKLTALGTDVTFYMAVSLMAALVTVAVFGLVYNMIAARGADRAVGPALAPRAVAFGLAGAALVVVVSNLEGVFELMARHGVGSEGFYGLVGVFGLDGPYDCRAAPGDCADWYPTRFWWWWKATRIGSAYDIQEFPFFSFQFGDLHAHVLAMPFLVTLLAVALHMLLAVRDDDDERGRLDVVWPVRHPGRFLLLALLAGGLVFLDAWTLPLAALMVVAVAAVVNCLRTGGQAGRALVDSLGFALPLLAAAFLFYLPFWLHLQADAEGINITRASLTPVGNPPEDSEVTRPLHFLLFWAPLLWAVLPFLVLYLYRRGRAVLNGPAPALAAAAWALPLVLWAFLVALQTRSELGWNPFDWLADADFSLGALGEELSERGWSLLTAGLLAVCVSAAGLAFLRQLRDQTASGPDTDADGGQLLASFLALFAFLLLLGVEFYYIRDVLGWRVNTVFRFWHQAWTLLGVAGGYGLYRLTLGWRLPALRLEEAPWGQASAWGLACGAAYTVFVAVDPWDVLAVNGWAATLGLFVAGASLVGYAVAAALRGASTGAAAGRLAWLGVSVLLLGAALVYPVTVALERTDAFRNTPQNVRSLDAFVHLRRDVVDSLEYEAIRWLAANVRGTPVVLEAVNTQRDYTDYSRVSALTGLPTVIGWVGHEITWRGYPSPGESAPFTARPADVATIYSTTDLEQARALLDGYGVEYVYVGRLEREQYGEAGLAKFGEFMVPVFQKGTVTIYQRAPETAALARPLP